MAQVLELAHVAGEGLGLQVFERGVRDALALDAELLRTLLQEVAHQQRNVLAALAQRWQAQADDVEAVEEVLAEQALAHALLQVLVGGGDHAHVGADRLLAADAVEVAVGEHAQQPGLQLGRHVADLVEEERAAVGLLEAAAALRGRAGEGAALVAEELGLAQVARDGGGVDGDEGRVAARAVAVQRARDQLLATARLAVDQHRGVGVREPADGAEDLLHRRGLAENLGSEGGFLACTVLVRGLLQCTPDERDRLVHVEGLGQVLEGAALEGCHRAVEVGVGGHDDDRQLRVALLDLLQQVQPRLAGHADVRQQRGRRLRRALELGEGVAGGAEAGVVDALAAERLFKHPADRAVVVDDPDGIHIVCTILVRAARPAFRGRDAGCAQLRSVIGSRIVKQVRPGRLSTSIMPWCCSMKLCASDRPSPLPPSRPDTSG